MEFCPIDNAALWANEIIEYSKKKQNRAEKSARACEMIDEKGYDINRNAAELKKLLLSLEKIINWEKDMPTYEGLRLKILKLVRVKFADKRRAGLKNTDFTIISNNCWGGMIYESYNLTKQSPTVGMFFMASDYIKFVTQLEAYLRAELSFIKPEDSRWMTSPEISGDKRFGSYPIGVLTLENGESVEIFFLHYHSEQDVLDKWTRRCKRVNRRRLLVKFNDQNGCTEADIEAFMSLPIKNKVFFTAQTWKREKEWQESVLCYFKAKQPLQKGTVTASHEPFGSRMGADITAALNSL